MPDFKFAHRATRLPGADPATDREVLCDGRPIARVRQIESGQQSGLWQWSAYWVSNDNRGTAESLADGLEAVKSRVTADALKALPPARRC